MSAADSKNNKQHKQQQQPKSKSASATGGGGGGGKPAKVKHPKSNKPKPVDQPSNDRRSYGIVAFRIQPLNKSGAPPAPSAPSAAGSGGGGGESIRSRIEYLLIQHNGGHWYVGTNHSAAAAAAALHCTDMN